MKKQREQGDTDREFITSREIHVPGVYNEAMIKNTFAGENILLRGILFLLIVPGILSLLTGCHILTSSEPRADLILCNGRVYTLNWGEPGPDGTPASDAPHDESGWTPDAEAIVIGGAQILFVGSTREAMGYQATTTRVVDLQGATVLPGLVDSHTHVAELGRNLSELSLLGAGSEGEIIARVLERARGIEAGQWIEGYGWDEGAWANQYPTLEKLSQSVPDHPVLLRSLHGFAVWGNRRALEIAKVDSETPDPSGGTILRDQTGNPTGVFLNRATVLLMNARGEPSEKEIESHFLQGLKAMGEAGYVSVHEAGVTSAMISALEKLATQKALPIRVNAMLSARDKDLILNWAERGPSTSNDGFLRVQSVKAYYDGALGSRGARLLHDYSDLPDHRGVAGANYAFDQDLVARMMGAGFQVAIHAIGDAGNRETLDFLADVMKTHPESIQLRHRIEHAQVVHPDDFARFRELNIIASMEPPHAVEDMTWAEERLGPTRVLGAYAWRTTRLGP